MKIKYAYIVEMRPEWAFFQGAVKCFAQRVKEIKPAVEETWAGLRTMCELINKEYIARGRKAVLHGLIP